jgi:uncharacterized protein
MSATTTQRKAPPPNVFVHSEPFWRGAREGKLLLQFCPASGRFQHFPRPLSLYSGTRNLEWREVSGRGVVYAHTVLRTNGLGADDRLPLILATVELEEKVRILANILGAAPGDIHIGDRVQLVWDKLDEATPYPAFALCR